MFNNTINPVLLDLGPLEIRWYGLMYVVGFILAYFIIPKISKHWKIELTRDDTADLLVYLAVGMVICARLAEVLIYNPAYYFSNPTDILAVWKGGLSFHGGLVGIILGIWFFSKKKKISFLKLLDIVSIPGSFGLFLGRIGNFINGELVGRLTDVPWCVYFKHHDGCRHPSQLYESFKNLVIFGILWQLKEKNKPDGFIFFTFLILYAVFRSIIEQFFREPEGYILGLTQGQFLNIFLLIAGIYGLAYIYDKKKEISN